MSGIAGIASKSGASFDDAQKQPLLEGVRRRGPNGVQSFSNDDIFLAHGHLGSADFAMSNLETDEDEPKIIGDLRLDDRMSLIEKLGIKTIDHDASDIELLAYAYKKWNTDVCHHIIGEFAFALWDPRKKLLFCARDHMGIRPFYYRATKDLITFSSDLKALGANHYQTFGDREISNFLVGVNELTEDLAHPGIKRLLPAHSLIWQNGKLDIEPYWELKIRTYDGKNPEKEFHDLFIKSIQDRMREGADVGAMLSGGLDSSAISCVASQHLSQISGETLKGFSLVFPNAPEIDESKYINAAARKSGLNSLRRTCDDNPAFQRMNIVLDEQQGFPLGPNSAVGQQIYELAGQHATRLLLDGHGGDEVVWLGGTRIEELAHHGHWLKALGLIETICAIYGDNKLLSHLGLIGKHSKSRLIRKLANAVRKRLEKWVYGAKLKSAWRHCLQPDFVERSGIKERQRAYLESDRKDHIVSDQIDQYDALTSPIITLAFEELDRASAAKGIESRYPFYDLRLVEFCLSLPSSEKLRKGETRSIMRRALKGILPEEIRVRQSKANFIKAISDGILDHHMDLLDDVQNGKAGLLYLYIKPDKISELIETFKSLRDRMNGYDVIFIWRILTLFIWLQNRDIINVDTPKLQQPKDCA